MAPKKDEVDELQEKLDEALKDEDMARYRELLGDEEDEEDN
ncbi:hypothetical protein [Roseitranquillus sediminis]|nr:hypothetical protein [Roseitranquillus sediminis]